ncbi:hypothetical protein ILYODFUR_024740 [Ilyodon furcidens]|uniref:Uncharacterized protein n=1 Tax=Ilyodon furcidens TaxID=33524 RepID=A0ABV0SZY7_9TELE
MQGPNSPYQRAWYPIFPGYPPQDSPRDMIECLLQVHKAHVDWLGELPCTLQDPAEGVELVKCPTATTKNHTALPKSEARLANGPSSPGPPEKTLPGRLKSVTPL